MSGDKGEVYEPEEWECGECFEELQECTCGEKIIAEMRAECES